VPTVFCTRPALAHFPNAVHPNKMCRAQSLDGPCLSVTLTWEDVPAPVALTSTDSSAAGVPALPPLMRAGPLSVLHPTTGTRCDRTVAWCERAGAHVSATSWGVIRRMAANSGYPVQDELPSDVAASRSASKRRRVDGTEAALFDVDKQGAVDTVG